MKIVKFILLAVVAFALPLVMVYQNKETETQKVRADSLQHTIDSLNLLLDTGYVNKYFRGRDSLIALLQYERNFSDFIKRKYTTPQNNFEFPSEITIHNITSNDSLKAASNKYKLLENTVAVKIDSSYFRLTQIINKMDSIQMLRSELEIVNREIIEGYDALFYACSFTPFDTSANFNSAVYRKSIITIFDNLNRNCQSLNIQNRLEEALNRKSRYKF